MLFRRRHLRRRPELNVSIQRERRDDTWPLFAPFHYMSADLGSSAQCYTLRVGGRLAAFCGVVHFPHPKVRDIKRVSRLVTLPDWQGLGLAFVLVDAVAAMFRSCALRLRTYPAHPALVRNFDRSPVWKLTKKPGQYAPRRGKTSTLSRKNTLAGKWSNGFGGRPCATFEYVGPAHPDTDEARAVLGYSQKP